MSQNVYASFDSTERAFNQVRKELHAMNLLFDGSKLDRVDCWHERWTFRALRGWVGIEGFYDYEDGAIHIPAFYPKGINPHYEERKLLDVMRHEFGHALADAYKRFFRGGKFKASFGASYGERVVYGKEVDWEDVCVTKYAASMTQEDFAETFMFFVKHKGKLPARFKGKRPIEKKWKTVGLLVKEIAAVVKKEVRRKEKASSARRNKRKSASA